MKRLWKLRETNHHPTDFYVFDVETAKRFKSKTPRPNKHLGKYDLHWNLEGEFIFGVIYGLNYTRVIHSIEEFIETLKEPRFKNKKVFAHNAGDFDLAVLFGNIIEFDPECLYNGSRFICATNGNAIFADSLNIFVGASVKRLGQMLKLEKQQLGNQKNVSKGGYGATEINYCIRDCEIVWEALYQLFSFVGSIKITQASLSLTYFRRYAMPFHIDHNENNKYFWDSYYGGRTEAFKIGKTHAKVIDNNSIYPFAMREQCFPNPKSIRVELDVSLKKAKQFLDHYEGCMYCTVEHDDNWIGYLPVKTDNKLLFPVGTLTGCWNFDELRFALDSGKVRLKKVTKVVYGDRWKSPFIDFVDTLILLKIKAENEGNEGERDRVKRILNSLYGKLAQRITEEQIYLKDYEKQFHIIQEYQKNGRFLALKPFSSKRNDAYLIVKPDKNVDLSYAIPSLSSYVTSFARVLLLKKMIEMKDCGIVYCDTDSIFFEIDPGVVSEKHLGGWKVEKKIVTEIKGLKNYKYISEEKAKEVWRVKGVPIDQGKTIEMFRDGKKITVPAVKQINENTFEYYNLSKTKESLTRSMEVRTLVKRTKVITNKYDKRIVSKNGTTKPIKL